MTAFITPLVARLHVLAAAVLTSLSPGLSQAAPRDGDLVVVLKLDDFDFDGSVHPGWIRAMGFLNREGLTASIGIVGQGLERPSLGSMAWLKAQAEHGHEVWNHGYCHCRPEAAQPASGQKGAEFRGMDLDYQRDHILRTQKLAQEKLGITLTTFGAPFNATDDVTTDAIATAPELTVWMFKETDADTSLTVLPRTDGLNIEYPVHKPDFDAFLAAFADHPGHGVVVLQGHPRSWSRSNRFGEFKRIVRHLKDQGAVFVTPSDAAAVVAP